MHTDHLGAPRAVSNGATVLWRWDGEAFGNSPPNERVAGLLRKLTMPVRFPGQYYDQETGINYNYFRDYSPSTGRYVESDPIGLAGGLNTYAYVGGSPVSWADLLGLQYQPKNTMEAWCLRYPTACREQERDLYKQMQQPRRSGLSGKEGSKDCPSWAKEDGGPLQNESGKDYAERLMNNKYGPGEWDSGAGSEFNQIKKWADRAF